jgi:toxin HigB-1
MIKSVGNKIAEDLYNDKKSKALSKFPSEILRVARRKILYIHDADQLIDLKVPPDNRLEVQVVDYHK